MIKTDKHQAAPSPNPRYRVAQRWEPILTEANLKKALAEKTELKLIATELERKLQHLQSATPVRWVARLFPLALGIGFCTGLSLLKSGIRALGQIRNWPVMRKECASCLLCAPTVRGVTGNARLAGRSLGALRHALRFQIEPSPTAPRQLRKLVPWSVWLSDWPVWFCLLKNRALSRARRWPVFSGHPHSPQIRNIHRQILGRIGRL